jgi:hypothetical protein
MYSAVNFKTKKALKDAVAKGERIGIYDPSPFQKVVTNGKAWIEGPWFPEPHKWYAGVEMKNGVIVKVE